MTSELVKYRWKADEQSACTKINGLEPAFSPATPIPSLHWEANHPPRPGWFWPLLLLPVGPPPVGQHLWFSECLQLIPLPNSHHYYLHVLKSHPPYTFLWHPRFSFSGQGLLLFSKQGVYPLYLFFFFISPSMTHWPLPSPLHWNCSSSPTMLMNPFMIWCGLAVTGTVHHVFLLHA